MEEERVGQVRASLGEKERIWTPDLEGRQGGVRARARKAGQMKYLWFRGVYCHC